jgi:hypothetical protein
MADKTGDKVKISKGAEYCNVKGTSCFYNKQDVCVNCGRTKGWRKRTKDCPMCNTNDKVTTAKSYDWKCCPSCGRKFN